MALPFERFSCGVCVLFVLVGGGCKSDHTGARPVASDAAPEPPPPPAPVQPVIRLQSAGIDSLLIEPSGRDAVRLAKESGSWKVVAPEPKSPANASQVEFVLKNLDEVEFVMVSKAEDKQHLHVHVVAKRADTTVLDVWLGSAMPPRRALLQVTGTQDVWIVRGLAPLIFYVTGNEFREKKRK